MFESDVITNVSQSSLADHTLAEGPVEGQPLTEAGAQGWVPRTCFKHGPPDRSGLELEFVVHESSRLAHLPPPRLAALHDELLALSLRGRITIEPGGQVELSSQPADDLPAVVRQIEADLPAMVAVAQRHGARLRGLGIDPLAPPPRCLNTARYDAMEGYLDRWGPAGRAMMRSTASVQVNVEAGRTGRGDDDLRRRWDLLHAIGPALIAVFGNSAHQASTTSTTSSSTTTPELAPEPAPTPGWQRGANLRQGVWQALDPARCGVPVIGPNESLPDAWTRWVLDAPLLLVQRPDSWAAPPGLTFRQWLRAGQSAVPDRPPATLRDLRLHLTTVFPPVRARGHFEVRYLDAQPGPWWRVPAAVVTALLADDDAGDHALAAAEPVAGGWQLAARRGLADPALARAGRQLLSLARGALERTGRPDEKALAGLIDQYDQRWTARARTPGTHPYDSQDSQDSQDGENRQDTPW